MTNFNADLLDGLHSNQLVLATTQVIAGNGLTGGGALSANRTITLGTPSTCSTSTSNNTTATSHTHALTGVVPTSRSVSAGNGLTGGGDLSANRSIVLGTPGTITGTSTNSVTASSHTHEIDATAFSDLEFHPHMFEQRNSSFGTTAIREVAYGNGLWVAVGETGKLASGNIFISYDSSFNDSGYQKFPNGLIIQWGYAMQAEGNKLFPIAFPTKALSIAFSETTLGNISWNTGAIIVSNTTYRINNSDLQNRGGYWIAIGY